ncbi:hypothetical protein BV20DRAFT_978653 [Pilatotrama ljubarskyi]|nr:hypothetical protein BV20DRAFT_978653 [Pilatotrama ljubarskyi]
MCWLRRPRFGSFRILNDFPGFEGCITDLSELTARRVLYKREAAATDKLKDSDRPEIDRRALQQVSLDAVPEPEVTSGDTCSRITSTNGVVTVPDIVAGENRASSCVRPLLSAAAAHLGKNPQLAVVVLQEIRGMNAGVDDGSCAVTAPDCRPGLFAAFQ